MYILTQSEQLEKSKNKIYLVDAPEIEKEYLEAGYKSYERSYKLTCHHKDYSIVCPVFRNNKKGAEPVVVIPEFFIPGRPYPVYIYLFGIDLYSSNPDMSQREAAKATRERFGLNENEFVHTTLGRALKTFVSNIDEVLKLPDSCIEEKTEEVSKKDADHNNHDTTCNGQESNRNSASTFPKVNSTTELRTRVAQVLGGKLIQKKGGQVIATYHELVWEWFKKYKRLLL